MYAEQSREVATRGPAWTAAAWAGEQGAAMALFATIADCDRLVQMQPPASTASVPSDLPLCQSTRSAAMRKWPPLRQVRARLSPLC